jgi:hypothetical protein
VAVGKVRRGGRRPVVAWRVAAFLVFKAEEEEERERERGREGERRLGGWGGVWVPEALRMADPTPPSFLPLR